MNVAEGFFWLTYMSPWALGGLLGHGELFGLCGDSHENALAEFGTRVFREWMSYSSRIDTDLNIYNDF